MVPGLTSPGGKLPPPSTDEDAEDLEKEERELKEGDVAVVESEGKKEACMVGMLKMGTEDMKKAKKGVAIESGHYLGDGLWKMRLE